MPGCRQRASDQGFCVGFGAWIGSVLLGLRGCLFRLVDRGGIAAGPRPGGRNSPENGLFVAGHGLVAGVPWGVSGGFVVGAR